MIRFVAGIMFVAVSFFQADPVSKWGVLLFGVQLMIWDGVDSNGNKLDTIIENQKVINNNIKKDSESQ
jgi:hypothetical protein